MAIRSGAGTGVIVSLVVFILATVFLLVLSIVFYATNRGHEDKLKDAEKSLDVYAKQVERSSDAVQGVVALANSTNQSVVAYLNNQVEQRNLILNGNASATLDVIKSEFGNDVNAGSPVAITINRLQTQLDSRQKEVDAHVAELASTREVVRTLEEQLDNQASSNQISMQAVKDQWQDVQDESAELNKSATDWFSNRANRDTRLKGGFQGRIDQLEEDIDVFRIENSRLESTIADLREKVDSGRMHTVDPATLVDGSVLEISSGNEVFIDRGSQDRIVLGMTFEIYDSASQLRADANGNFFRGKASIEVIKIGKTTSTAKITRSTPSQPIVRDNIIVNAVYDPNYKYSFLVHGKFDANSDGIPESNNRFIKDRIKRWGGRIIEDAGMLPGDLDFLVLGISPEEPAGRPVPGATPAMMDDYARRKRAFLDYEHLLIQARAAQVPVLTANRLNILTGQHN